MSSGNVGSNSLWADVMVPCLSAVLDCCDGLLGLSVSPFSSSPSPPQDTSCLALVCHYSLSPDRLVCTQPRLGRDCPSKVFCAASIVKELLTSHSQPLAEASFIKGKYKEH